MSLPHGSVTIQAASRPRCLPASDSASYLAAPSAAAADSVARVSAGARNGMALAPAAVRSTSAAAISRAARRGGALPGPLAQPGDVTRDGCSRRPGEVGGLERAEHVRDPRARLGVD